MIPWWLALAGDDGTTVVEVSRALPEQTPGDLRKPAIVQDPLSLIDGDRFPLTKPGDLRKAHRRLADGVAQGDPDALLARVHLSLDEAAAANRPEERTSRQEDALSWIDRFLAEVPEGPQAERARVMRAMLLVELGRPELALEAVEVVLDGEGPYAGIASLVAGELHYAAGDPFRAMGEFKRAAESGGVYAPYARYGVAWCLLGAGQVAPAGELLVVSQQQMARSPWAPLDAVARRAVQDVAFFAASWPEVDGGLAFIDRACRGSGGNTCVAAQREAMIAHLEATGRQDDAVAVRALAGPSP